MIDIYGSAWASAASITTYLLDVPPETALILVVFSVVALIDIQFYIRKTLAKRELQRRIYAMQPTPVARRRARGQTR